MHVSMPTMVPQHQQQHIIQPPPQHIVNYNNSSTNAEQLAQKKAQQEAKAAAAAERKKRADEYDALNLMQKVNDGQGVAVTTIPNRPSPSNIFVFSSHGDPAKADDWRIDGYQWKQNGSRVIIIENHQMKKIYFHVYTAYQMYTGEFQRIVFKSEK